MNLEEIELNTKSKQS